MRLLTFIGCVCASIICDIKYGLVLLLVLEVPVNIEEGRFFVRCALGKRIFEMWTDEERVAQLTPDLRPNDASSSPITAWQRHCCHLHNPLDRQRFQQFYY
jgi:hypothetical protein